MLHDQERKQLEFHCLKTEAKNDIDDQEAAGIKCHLDKRQKRLNEEYGERKRKLGLNFNWKNSMQLYKGLWRKNGKNTAFGGIERS